MLAQNDYLSQACAIGGESQDMAVKLTADGKHISRHFALGSPLGGSTLRTLNAEPHIAAPSLSLAGEADSEAILLGQHLLQTSKSVGIDALVGHHIDISGEQHAAGT